MAQKNIIHIIAPTALRRCVASFIPVASATCPAGRGEMHAEAEEGGEAQGANLEMKGTACWSP